MTPGQRARGMDGSVSAVAYLKYVSGLLGRTELHGISKPSIEGHSQQPEMGGEFIRLAFRTEKSLTFKDQNFNIFAGGSDEPVLSIHLPDTTARGPHPAPSFYHPGDHRGGTEILSWLCQKVRTLSKIDRPIHC